jgi:predicted flap endonuclease-1-like 5' DNA nuclease
MLAFIGLFIGISSLIRGFQGAGWGTIILGVIEIVLSIILFMNAGGAAAWLPWVLGGLAIMGGILTLIAAFGLRRVEHQIEDAKEQAADVAAQAREAGAAQAKAAKAAAATAAVEAAAVVDEPVGQDLTAVEGIGPKTAEALQAAGVNNYADLAALSPDQIHTILKDAGLSADPSTWPEQASLAMAGKMDELKAYQDKLQGGRA